MVNYNNGKIYKIEPLCNHEDDEIYIGSTTKKYLSSRMVEHRQSYKRWKNGQTNKTMSFELFEKYGLENCDIVLIENVNVNTKDELFAREKHYIKTLKCVNKLVPGRTKKENYEDNKERILESQKQYYNDNKEALKIKLKKYREKNKDTLNLKKGLKFHCEICNGNYTRSHKARHLNSKLHTAALENL